MKKITHQYKSTEIVPVRWIFGGLTLVTLYFQTNLYDPFNSPKMWISIFIASWLIGYLISFRGIIIENKNLKITFYLYLAFIASGLLATVFSDFKYTSIFGDTQRRNGFISYLSLATILLATSVFVRTFNIKRLYYVTYFIGILTAFYAYLQTSGQDFVKWNNDYNAIIGTLGNPNFASALMAVMGVLIFASIFISDFKVHLRFFAGLLSITLLVLIFRSNARQGLLSYVLGAGLFLVIWLFIKHHRLGILAASIGVFVFVFSVLGMLQVGPLERFLYKPSVTVRGYYWRAGIEMLKQNPLFGVGMDRYGLYFKQLREVGYPLNYGFEITSSNAHNTFIQMFATGGVFLGLSYLILNAYVFRRAVVGLQNLGGNNRLLLAGVFSAWISFHAQSLVSIDNIGISIWGWVLGGSIIGLSVSSTVLDADRKLYISKPSEVNLKRLTASVIPTVTALMLIAILYRGEVNTFKAMGNFDLNDQNNVILVKNLQLTAVNTPLIDINYKLRCSYMLIQAGFIEDGLTLLRKINTEDPRNTDAIVALAETHEAYNQISEAITYREKLALLDPWNAVNYLKLGRNYKLQGDNINSNLMLEKILSFASGSEGGPIAEQAKLELAR
jgi:O-antigen ligase